MYIIDSKLTIVMEGASMKLKGFTLIELMVVLSIIVIIATATVPKVQVWIARNRGNQAVSQLISDISKAKSISGYTVNDVVVGGARQYVGQRPETGIMLRATSYSIIQRTDMNAGAWSDVPAAGNAILKKVSLPLKVSLHYVNDQETSDSAGMYSPTVVLTSSGRFKDGSDNTIISNIGGNINCPGGVNSPLNGKRVFIGILRSMIDGTDGIWYLIEMDQAGEYAVCSTVETSSGLPVWTSTTAGYIEL
jgi:prepilin-type N-terminal cleavage/methylation domain-containing protein